MSTAYHPQTDGQTERVNQILEQYLRCFIEVNEKNNWAQFLPTAEFAYNNTPNATTRISLFFTNKGYNPSIAVHLERDLSSARARDYAVNLEELHSELRSHIVEAQARYQVQADKHRLPAPDFQIGDLVYVRAKFIRSTRPTK